MEEARKRQRFESRQDCRSPSTSEQIDSSPAKRLCHNLDCKNVDIFYEIVSEMNSEDVDFAGQKIQEDLVWDVMETLREEIVASPVCEDESITSCSTCDERHYTGPQGEELPVIRVDSVENGVEYKSCKADFEYLVGASDDELGIPSSPQSAIADDRVDDCFLAYYGADYGFYECVLMEREAEQELLLQTWWDYNNIDSNKQGCGDLLFVEDGHCQGFSP